MRKLLIVAALALLRAMPMPIPSSLKAPLPRNSTQNAMLLQQMRGEESEIR
jgi:hypothetical protein